MCFTCSLFSSSCPSQPDFHPPAWSQGQNPRLLLGTVQRAQEPRAEVRKTFFTGSWACQVPRVAFWSWHVFSWPCSSCSCSPYLRFINSSSTICKSNLRAFSPMLRRNCEVSSLQHCWRLLYRLQLLQKGPGSSCRPSQRRGTTGCYSLTGKLILPADKEWNRILV